MSNRVILTLGVLVLAAGSGAFILSNNPGNEAKAALSKETQVLPERAAATSATVARLGELELQADELNTVLANLPEDARAQMRSDRSTLETWIRARLAEKAVVAQADLQGWQQRPEVQRMTRAAVEQIVLRSYLQSVSQVPEGYPSEDELKAAYDQAQSNLQTPPLYRVSQIFLAVAAVDSEEKVRQKAVDLARRAQADKADFAALAKAFSEDRSTAGQGGDAGLQPLQNFVPEMRPELARLKPGTVSEPLRSADGYHIIKLAEVQPARRATLDEVRVALTQTLRNQRQEQIAKAYLDGMLSSATLSIDGAQLSKLLKPEAK